MHFKSCLFKSLEGSLKELKISFKLVLTIYLKSRIAYLFLDHDLILEDSNLKHEIVISLVNVRTVALHLPPMIEIIQ